MRWLLEVLWDTLWFTGRKTLNQEKMQLTGACTVTSWDLWCDGLMQRLCRALGTRWFLASFHCFRFFKPLVTHFFLNDSSLLLCSRFLHNTTIWNIIFFLILIAYLPSPDYKLHENEFLSIFFCHYNTHILTAYNNVWKIIQSPINICWNNRWSVKNENRKGW